MTHPAYLPDVLAALREAQGRPKDVAAIEVAVHRKANQVITTVSVVYADLLTTIIPAQEIRP